ncbi:MAG: serine hydrolase domain-containing protein [Pyrinomonadaceae bacterium]
MKLVYALVLVLVVTLAIFAQPSASQAAAEKYARDLIGFVTSGDRAGYQKFVEANFGKAMLDRPMQQHLGFMSSLHDQTRGWEYVKVQEWNPNEVIVVVKSKLTGSMDALLVRVAPEGPYKIIGIGLRPPIADPTITPKKLNADQAVKDLEAFLKKLAEADVFSGSVLMAKDGKVVYKGAFGMANRDFNAPNKIDTKFNLGSMNKMFTGVAIAQLVEKGKVSYDDPLAKYIPDFPNPEAAQKIKIKHLLTHTAGLGGYFSERFQKLARDQIRSVDDMLNLAREDEKDIAFEPGSRWRYSNTGMMVLGKVIEIASGQTYYDYVRENIYRPAGMTNTDCYELDKVNTNLAVGYDKQFTDSGITWRNNIFAHVMRGGPHGGGYSTVEDLLKFDQALRSGKLVSAETFKLLTSPKPELNSPNYGYGFGVEPERNVAGHSGGFPGISSNLDMYLGSGWTAIVMSNYSRGSGPVSTKMAELIQIVGN